MKLEDLDIVCVFDPFRKGGPKLVEAMRFPHATSDYAEGYAHGYGEAMGDGGVVCMYDDGTIEEWTDEHGQAWRDLLDDKLSRQFSTYLDGRMETEIQK